MRRRNRRVALLMETRLALLHERARSRRRAPASIRGLSPCRAGRLPRTGEGDRRIAAGTDGLDPRRPREGAGDDPGRLRRALRRAAREAAAPRREAPGARLRRRVGEAEVRADVREIAGLDYRFDRYKSRPGRRVRDGQPPGRRRPPPSGGASRAAAQRGGGRLADAAAWARDLGNTPANDLGPAEFAARSAGDGKRAGVPVRALDKKRIERERMGGSSRRQLRQRAPAASS